MEYILTVYWLDLLLKYLDLWYVGLYLDSGPRSHEYESIASLRISFLLMVLKFTDSSLIFYKKSRTV